MVCWTPLTTIWPVWARKNIKSQTVQCVTNALSGTCLHVTSILAQKHGVRNGDSDHCVRVYDVHISKNPSSNHALHRQGPSTSCQHLITFVNSVVGLLECLQEAINSVLHQLLACVQHGSSGVVTAWCSNPILWRWPRFHAMHLFLSLSEVLPQIGRVSGEEWTIQTNDCKWQAPKQPICNTAFIEGANRFQIQ